VALSAVINVITKTGPDVDGFRLKGGIGNHGQLHGDFVFGKSYYDLNIFTWGSIYSAKGEKRHMNAEENIFEKGGDYMIGEVKEKPAFDIGLMLTWKHLRLLYTTNNSKVTPPLTPNIYMMPYLSDHYTTIDGNTVGKNLRSHHFQLAYNNTFGRFDVGASFYYDNTSHMQYNVQAETSVEKGISFFLPLPDSLTYILNKHNGVYTDFEARENNIGFHLKGDYHYVNNANHKGTISVGTHFSRFQLEDIRYMIGCDYNKIFYNAFNYKDFYKGTEYSNDAYIQVKHQWHNWILNAGLRYDYIRHYNDKKLNKYSPRATLIYLTPTWMVRFNYSHSFVDAPYLYRKSNDNYYNSMGYDEVTLEPQTLDSWQLSIGSPSLLKGLMLELNAFYNVTDNVIVNGLNRYSNEDQLTVAGIELSANYSLRKFTSNLTASWLKPLNTGDGSSLRDHLYSIPEFSANLVMAYQLSNHFKAHTYICLYGEQYDMSLLDSHYNGFLDTRCIVNAGLSYNLKSVSFGLNVHNLLNTKYRQGGYSLSSIPQKGRWLMFDVAFRY